MMSSMSKTILIVEDHKDFRKEVRHFLEVSKVDARLVEAASGEEGVLVAKETQPQIVLMDFWLGGLNGIDAAAQIKETLPSCSIIMLTMFDTKEIGKLNTRNHIKTFINKGDLFKQLIPSLKKILNSVN